MIAVHRQNIGQRAGRGRRKIPEHQRNLHQEIARLLLGCHVVCQPSIQRGRPPGRQAGRRDFGRLRQRAQV